jgi:hypothetical protein
MGAVDYLIGLGPVAAQNGLAMLVALWLARDRTSRAIPRMALAVVLACAVASLVLFVELGWLWGHFQPLRPDSLPPEIPRTEEMWKAFQHNTKIAGWVIYGAAITAGLVSAAMAAGFFGASKRRSLALTAVLILVFFLTPGFIWLEFTTSCILGDAALLRGGALC